MSLDVTTLALAKSYTNQYGGSGGGSSVPKPLTFDYMPEGYPTKSVQTTTLMEEQELAFEFSKEEGVYVALVTNAFKIVKGQTYTVNWDGTEYICVPSLADVGLIIGNLSIAGMGDDTGEPFIYVCNTDGIFGTLDTSASHTISVKTTAKTVTPMAYDYMPEGYPTKIVRTVTPMKEQQVAFALMEEMGAYMARLTNAFEIVEGQTYTVNWDGTEHECVGFFIKPNSVIGNLSIVGEGSDTGEPFVYAYNAKRHTGMLATLDTAASHTISVKTTAEIVTPIDEKYLPENLATKADVDNVHTTAVHAQTTAENAQTTANNAKTTADAALPKTGGAVSGNLTVDAKNDSYRTVISAGKMALQYVNREGTAENMVVISGRAIPSIVAGEDGPSGFKLSDRGLSLGYTSNNKDGIHLHHENGSSTAGEIVIQHTNQNNQAKERISIASTGRITCNNSLKFDCGSEIEVVQTYGKTGGSAIILRSSTANSTKRFRITVDDTGALKATEVT